MANTLLME